MPSEFYRGDVPRGLIHPEDVRQVKRDVLRELEQISIRPEDRNAAGDLLVHPDGPVSALDEQRWKMVRTPAFKKWFAESEVVSAHGEPLLVYRGNKNKGVQDYREEAAHNGLQGEDYASSDLIGIYFSKRRNNAKFYAEKDGVGQGEVQEVFLRIEKPKYGYTSTNIKKDSTILHEYDGIIDDKAQEVAVFHPDQIFIASVVHSGFST